MYRQVSVNPKDRDFQRIVWLEDPEHELKHYCLNTVTYGTASASFLAVRALHQTAVDNESDPRITNIVKQDFYMDDLITGTDTLTDALYIKGKITDVLQDGCFPLRKWRSNDKRVLAGGNTNNECEYTITDKQNTKTLGLLWRSDTDTLSYSVNLDFEVQITKRNVLSAISKIFDPLGLISPVTIRAKLIMQYLWQAKVGWDEPLPEDIYKSWQQFQRQLTALNNLSIPRQVTLKEFLNIELHGFCDASERAYGACVYIRTTHQNGSHNVTLLCAKSRVAPLKRVTLPRLELCGAVLLTRLINTVSKNISIQFNKRKFWCDSTIVLSWIAAGPTSWKTFVANRVADILESSTVKEWHHVNSEANPADIVSRGSNPEHISLQTAWWHGPEFFSLDSEHWPIQRQISTPPLVDEEARKSITLTFAIYNNELDNLIDKFSDFFKLQRVVAFVLRFAHNSNPKCIIRLKGALSHEELNKSTLTLVKIAQESSFL
ncbi:Pao retrotransposon peptidase [Popillia japonica]|uniref:Pao retrotransposon peptidase n=1 Tax=Popillia japonica TaxID=7064 RepID=A0AAW1IT67_POPJA